MKNPSVFLTPREAAQHLRVSTATLERWRSEGRGPQHVRIGRRVLYRMEDLEDFVRGCVVRTAVHNHREAVASRRVRSGHRYRPKRDGDARRR